MTKQNGEPTGNEFVMNTWTDPWSGLALVLRECLLVLSTHRDREFDTINGGVPTNVFLTRVLRSLGSLVHTGKLDKLATQPE